jgi:CheY-like chemotaxis protein
MDAHVVYDGVSALAALSSFRPEMVLLDLGLPGMSGFEVAQEIRASAPGTGPLLVALTGWGQPDARQRTREAGFDHHLVKPVDLTALQSMLAIAATPRA